jgi:hypothetical protein
MNDNQPMVSTMKRITRYRFPQFIAASIALLVIAALFASCAHGPQLDTAVIDQDTAAEIQANANVIILEQADPPLDVYNQTLLYLNDAGVNVERADEEALTVTTAPHPVHDDLFIRMHITIEPEAGMARLRATTQWTADPALLTWNEAYWAEGPQQEAFEATFALISGIPHERLLTARE